MTEQIRVTPRAYCKIILHAAKYPHCAINGVLLYDAKRDKKSKVVTIVDSIPLFHICLHLVPMAEVALMMVDTVAQSQGLAIAGYYMANEALDDMSVEKPATRIADKIAEACPNACLLVVDNRRLSLTMEDHALRVMHSVDGKWKDMEDNSYQIEPEATDATAALLHRHADKHLIDFDNHFDDITHDWRNPHLNEEIDRLIAK
ncbi:Uncharacterised protein family (UPF0172) [Nesidiocoris tenuis]|nr:Uncharacterised protein family (UPF0172) [Nesidiocoris tenuis]